MPVVVTPKSHTDHRMTTEQRDYALRALETAHDTASGIVVVAPIELPPELGTVPCALYGPLMGDPPVAVEHIEYASRGRGKGRRKTLSRMVRWPLRQVRTITVVAGPDADAGEPCILYTMYGGFPAPRELGDKSLAKASPAEQEEARIFWSQHALAFED